MLLVAGETLVDLVVADDETIVPALGGAPSNTAVALARLGVPVAFAGAISTDRFGQRLLRRLADDEVITDAVVRTELPTSLAMAELDEHGSASYRFYFDGTSVPALDALDTSTVTALFTGGLGLVLEPMASTIESAIVSAELPVVIDVNCRPDVIDDRAAFLARIDRVVAHASVVKVSDDDLDVLHPDTALEEQIDRLLGAGARSLIVTAGSDPTLVVTADGRRDLDVPTLAPGTAVVDTIGAGDTFIAGVIAGLHESGGLGRSAPSLDALADAVRLGQRAAAVVVTRRGANPPTRTELD